MTRSPSPETLARAVGNIMTEREKEEKRMKTDQQQILKRIRNKAEVLKMDLKAKSDPKHHDMNEILLLIDMMERM